MNTFSTERVHSRTNNSIELSLLEAGRCRGAVVINCVWDVMG